MDEIKDISIFDKNDKINNKHNEWIENVINR